MKSKKNIKINRDKKKNKRILKFKVKKKIRNKINNSISEVDKFRNYYIKKQKQKLFTDLRSNIDYTNVFAPKVLSLINNPNQVIEFINKLKRSYNEREKVFVDLSSVIEIGHDAIVILLSIMIKFKANKIKFNGNFPKSKNARNILFESKFFDHLNENISSSKDYNIGDSKSIHTHGNLIVDSELAGTILLGASNTILNKYSHPKGAYRVLQEIMHNTVSHAKGLKEIEAKHWWLSVDHDKINKIVKFSFIDFGVGVFRSLIDTPNNSKWSKGVEYFKKLVNLDQNEIFFQEIIEGKIHASVTGHHYRGKGIPGVNQTFKRNQINNLYIITNNVMYIGKNNSFIKLSTWFEGTFYYFELNEDCYE
ncbi:hypothetical protein [Algoriphagus marinus]|uniref:hypothetical protein n=1 Tax=Algoriphagus marinus TaxID=1925762 RepID=UPI00094BBABB|nr:hypothetical protein [Algoriphagus marinus]